MTAGLVGALVVVVVSAALQRISGIGFALLSGPAMALVLDVWPAVTLVIVGNTLVALVVLVRTAKRVDWPKAVTLTALGVPGVLIGFELARLLDADLTKVVLGAAVVASLGATVWWTRRGRTSTAPRHPATRGATTGVLGVVNGVMTMIGGLSGPTVTVLAAVQRWSPRSFVGTIQVPACAAGVVAILLRVPEGQLRGAGVDPLFALGFVGLVGLGLVVGDVAARFVPVRAAWLCAIAFSFLGGLLAVGVGAWALWAG